MEAMPGKDKVTSKVEEKEEEKVSKSGGSVEQKELFEEKMSEKEAHKVYEWTPEMTAKAEEMLKQEKFVFNENMYSMIACFIKIVERLEREAGKYWNIFYKHNQANFFKDRHYIAREFPEMLTAGEKASPKSLVLLDCGCGVGNAFFPMLGHIPNLIVHAFDFSPLAIDLIKKDPKYDPSKIDARVCDVVNKPIPEYESKCDFAFLIFVLSSISPENHLSVLSKIFAVTF